MSIADMANDAAARQRALDQLREQALQRAAKSTVAVPGLTEEARGLIDQVDLGARKIHDAQVTGASAQAGIPKSTAVAVGAGLGAAGALAALLGGVTPAFVPGIALGVLGLTTTFAIIARSSAKYNIGWAQREQQKQQADIDSATQQLAQVAANGRAASQQELLTRLRDAGAAGMPVESLTGGAAGIVVMQHVESDPYVAQAALRSRKLEDAVAHKDAMLAGTRADLFAGEPERMRGKWGETAEIAACLTLLAAVGGAIGTGIGVGSLLGSTAGAVAGGALALGIAFSAKKVVPQFVAPRVEANLRRELAAEVAAERVELPARQQALKDARADSLASYTDFLRDNPVPAPTPGTELPGVKVGDGEVVVGGIRVDRKK